MDNNQFINLFLSDYSSESDTSINFWDINKVHSHLTKTLNHSAKKTSERILDDLNILPKIISRKDIVDENSKPLIKHVEKYWLDLASKKRSTMLLGTLHDCRDKKIIYVQDGRGEKRWLPYKEVSYELWQDFFNKLLLTYKGSIQFWPTGSLLREMRKFVDQNNGEEIKSNSNSLYVPISSYNSSFEYGIEKQKSYYHLRKENKSQSRIEESHLDDLESESIHIIREVIAEAENPVMLYSIGKDSSVMLHLAKKAFFPAKPPFPLLHVDTKWKFKEMYEFREKVIKSSDMELLIYSNPDGVSKNINPIDHGSSIHTNIMKTEALKQALDKYKFDFAFGGARRDEEKSRAKERVFSLRSKSHNWDPKNQRPELWDKFNCKIGGGENIRVFPLSNWTELDIWQYILREEIEIVPLYFSSFRPVLSKAGSLILVDDERLDVSEHKNIEIKQVRFRTLGCYPLSGAVASGSKNLSEIIRELIEANSEEREGRTIDSDSESSMEKKKKEGYF